MERAGGRKLMGNCWARRLIEGAEDRGMKDLGDDDYGEARMGVDPGDSYTFNRTNSSPKPRFNAVSCLL